MRRIRPSIRRDSTKSHTSTTRSVVLCLSLFGPLDHSHRKRERIKRVEDFAPVVLVSLSLFYHFPVSSLLLPSEHFPSLSASPRLPKGTPLSSPNKPSTPGRKMSDAEKKEAGSTQGDAVEEVQATEKPAPRKREYKDFGHEEEKPTRVYLLLSCARNRRSSHPSLIEINVDMSKVIPEPTTRFGDEIDRFPPRRLSSRLRTSTTRRRLTWRQS